MPAPTDTEGTVRTLLASAGLSLTDEQVAMYVRVYPRLRASADALFAMPEVRYEQPAVIFPAAV
ncbi:MAG: hypothetical protein AB7L91_13185 [Dehalococcoidia bacterium]